MPCCCIEINNGLLHLPLGCPISLLTGLTFITLRYIDTVFFFPYDGLDKITTIKVMQNLKNVLFIMFDFVDYCYGNLQIANRIVSVHTGNHGIGIYAIMLPSSGFSVAHCKDFP